MNIQIIAKTGYLEKPNAEAAEQELQEQGFTTRLAKKHEEINIYTMVAKKVIKINKE